MCMLKNVDGWLVTLLRVQNFLSLPGSSGSRQEITLRFEQFSALTFCSPPPTRPCPCCFAPSLPLVSHHLPALARPSYSAPPLLIPPLSSPTLHSQSSAAPVFSGTVEEAASQVTPGVMERGGRERLVCVETVTWWSPPVTARPAGLAVPLEPQGVGAGITRGWSQGLGTLLTPGQDLLGGVCGTD